MVVPERGGGEGDARGPGSLGRGLDKQVVGADTRGTGRWGEVAKEGVSKEGEVVVFGGDN